MLKGFVLYHARSNQSIDEVSTQLTLIHSQINEIDSTLLASDDWLQTIILQTVIDQNLYQLSITLLKSRQELNLQEIICVLKEAENKIWLVNKLTVKFTNYVEKARQSDNQSHCCD